MDTNIKIPSIESQIIDGIENIEKKKKKRTDLERICKVVVSETSGLSKSDVVNTLTKMQQEGLLTVKQYTDGPVSYKINKHFKEVNEQCEGTKLNKEITDDGEQSISTSEGDAEHDYDNSDTENELQINDDDADDPHASQDSFCEFLDGVSSPKKVSVKCYPDQSSIFTKAQPRKYLGMRDYTSDTMDPQSPPACVPGDFAKIMGKMADMLNIHIEMLRDERNLTCRLRNTIDIMNDDIKHKATRIKELETNLKLTVKGSDADYHAHHTREKCSYQPATESHEMDEVKVAPSFKSQMEAYKKTTRKRYEEHLATTQAERNSEFNNPNIACESIIPSKSSNQATRSSKRRARQAKNLKQQQQQHQDQKEKQHQEQQRITTITEHNQQEQQQRFKAAIGHKELRESITQHEEDSSEKAREVMKEEKDNRGQNTRKHTTVVIGDSLVKNVQGWRLKRRCAANEKIVIRSFSGASVEDMQSYCQPTVKQKPNSIILHCGTNNLRTSQTEVQISQAIINLAKSIRSAKINVCISGLVARADDLESKRMKTNLILCDMCSEEKIAFVDHPNILAGKHFNGSKLHLNPKGDSILATNILEASRT